MQFQCYKKPNQSLTNRSGKSEQQQRYSQTICDKCKNKHDLSGGDLSLKITPYPHGALNRSCERERERERERG